MPMMLFSFRYLKIRSDDGRLFVVRDLWIILIVSTLIATLFHLMPHSAFFSTDGFLDRIGSLASALTGFYIAGLLAVATFLIAGSTLDDHIETGEAFWGRPNTDRVKLTRRDYVLSMFGYLAFLSLLLSLLSAACSGLSSALASAIHGKYLIIGNFSIPAYDVSSFLAKLLCLVPISHLVLTSGRSLYYLTYKIYDRKPEITGVVAKED